LAVPVPRFPVAGSREFIREPRPPITVPKYEPNTPWHVPASFAWLYPGDCSVPCADTMLNSMVIANTDIPIAVVLFIDSLLSYIPDRFIICWVLVEL
jgi:hypothetical protein